MTGIVFDIKRFAIHDGPGIRTTAFLKGCPLSCPWCQNPEGIARERQLWYTPSQCIHCASCVTACTVGALTAGPDSSHFIHIDRRKCTLAGDCISACPTGALVWTGETYAPHQLVDTFVRDQVFYDSSGGGITLSGGEPLMQAPFAREVLRLSNEAGLRTALETTLFTSRRVLESVLPYTDHILADIKIWDRDAHRRTVGVDNEPILSNIRFLAERGVPLTIRIPLIPGMTTREENIRPIARFVAGLPGDVPLELINFNPLASGKYRALEQEYEFAAYTAPYSEKEMADFTEFAAQEGVHLV